MTDSIFQTAGTVSGCITSLVFYPLDTYKSRLQLSIPGLNGLYRGCLPELASNTFSNLIYWSVYQTSRNMNYSPIESICYSSIIGNLIDSPLDYIKKHKQLGYATNTLTFTSYPFVRYSFLNCAYSLVYNTVYMKMLQSTDIEKRSSLPILIGCSIISSSVSYPVDYMRTYSIQTDSYRIFKWSSFWKGYFARLLYSTVYSTAYMKCFLLFTNHLV